MLGWAHKAQTSQAGFLSHPQGKLPADVAGTGHDYVISVRAAPLRDVRASAIVAAMGYNRKHRFRRACFGVITLAAFGLSGCGDSEQTKSSALNNPIVPLPPGNPFAALPLYVYPGTAAAKAALDLEGSAPEEAELAQKIAGQPAAEWFSYPLDEIGTEVDAYVSAATGAGELPVLVPYNVPNRDCGQYSSGGAQDPQDYRDWVDAFADAIGERPAVVVIEPDALPQLDTCLTVPDQAVRLELIRYFVEALSALPSTVVYLDAGHSSWISADIMAARLLDAGLAKARGFALNVSNYQFDVDLVKYAAVLIEELGMETNFIIDSSRNGNGPALGADSWCNPPGRALGNAPTADTDVAALDAYVWVKRPGESDGECRGGPAPGFWFAERALELAREATW